MHQGSQQLQQQEPSQRVLLLTRAALGSPAERAALGGGVNITPPANSRTRDRSEAGEAAIESSQRVLSVGILKIFLKRSQARSRSGQRSNRSLFALSATEMWLIIAAKPNFAQRLLRSCQRLCVSMGLIVSKGQGQGQGQVRSPNENVACLSCDTCFMGHLERRIRWWHSFLDLTQGKVNIRSN